MKTIIKKADLKDIRDVFELSNDSLVRSMSANSDKIIWENHVTWFNQKINDKNVEFYVIKSENTEIVGQVRFDNNESETIVSISLAREYRGKNMAEGILKDCMDLSQCKNFAAYIKPENIPSIKTFTSLGYEYKFDVVSNNLLLKKYVYTKV